VSVFGTNGKFSFEMNVNGQAASKHSVAFVKMGGADIAVPAKPLTTPSKFERLTMGLPQLAGSRRSDSEENYGQGIREVRRPFFDFFSMRPGADPNRPADQMVDTLERFVVVSPSVSMPYAIVALVLLAIFAVVRFVELLLNRLMRAVDSSIRIIADPNNPSIGTFNGFPCSLVHSVATTEAALHRLSEVNIQGTIKIKAFERRRDGFLIAYPVCAPLDFSIAFSPTAFLTFAMQTLAGLFESGYVHGSIDEGAFLVDGSNTLFLGRFEHSLELTNDPAKRADDVLRVAQIVRARLPDDPGDPLLMDLLGDMDTADPLERPLPSEILQHPLFWTGMRKVTLFCHLSDVLQSAQARSRGLVPLFEGRRKQIVGSDWMRVLDRSLVVEASQFATYAADAAADLVRLIRNKWLHMPHDARGGRLGAIGTSADDYFAYFDGRFPNLFLYSYYFVEKYAPNLLGSESKTW
jgi:hypothetical protein